jgi:melibiose permease/lactose/raffinose/galactose permease
MLIGGVIGAVCMLLMFTNFGLSSTAFVILFAACYLLWDISYGLNDIAYWSMLPSLSTDQKQREKIGSFARICANIGLFATVVGIIPITNALGAYSGDLQKGWFLFALIIIALMLGFQFFTIFGVKERKGYFKEEEKTSLREMFRVLVKNDQLLWIAIALSLFMIGYTTTASFGVYYFKYAYGDENMYPIFAAVLGISQLSALSVFNWFRARFSREKLYLFGTILVAAGYIVFFLAPTTTMLFIGIGGFLLFVGQAFIQMLMLMFLADTIEYGQWKLGKRNESITFSIQPFINKIGAAIATLVVGLTIRFSGINAAETAADVSAFGILFLKLAMMIFPLICILIGFFIYRGKFKINKEFYAKIIADLKKRGDLKEGT